MAARSWRSFCLLDRKLADFDQSAFSGANANSNLDPHEMAASKS